MSSLALIASLADDLADLAAIAVAIVSFAGLLLVVEALERV